MGALSEQVGGSHYQVPYQPVVLISKLRLNFFEGNVLKYITRAKAKNGLQDIDKAIHYCQLSIEIMPPMMHDAFTELDLAELQRYCELNECDYQVYDILFFMGLGENMRKVLSLLEQYRDEFDPLLG